MVACTRNITTTHVIENLKCLSCCQLEVTSPNKWWIKHTARHVSADSVPGLRVVNRRRYYKASYIMIIDNQSNLCLWMSTLQLLECQIA